MKISEYATLACAASALVILSGCSSVKVTTDYDHAAGFGKYQTYALEPPAKVPPLSPTADSALRNALREEMAKRGIREITPNEKPQLAVVPHVKLQKKYSVEQYTQWGYSPGVWPYYGGYYGAWAGAPYTYNTINSYTEGTLILDFLDTSSQKLVFRGTAVATVSDKPESNARKIEDAVKKIVARLPHPSPAPIAGNL
jgi:hypothetical protein